jgi:GTPase Era involved in 16S rRNA processing
VKRCLVVGRPNVGKTTFALNFAAFLEGREGRPRREGRPSREGSAGGRAPRLRVQPGGGAPGNAAGGPPPAPAPLVGPEPHTTIRLQTLTVRLPGDKGRRAVELVDSAGLDDDVHPDPAVRAGMAETLRALRSVDLVLHVVDAALAGMSGAAAALGETDRLISRFAPLRSAYAVLANKLDLPWARAGYLKVRDEFPDRAVIAISALRGTGFREVRAFVWDRL